MKLFHPVDERLSDCLDDSVGVLDQLDSNQPESHLYDTPSTDIIDGDGNICRDGAHDSGIDEPPTLPVENKKRKIRKTVVFENSGLNRGRKPSKRGRFSGTAEERATNDGSAIDGTSANSPLAGSSNRDTSVDPSCQRRSTRDRKTPIRLGY